MNRSQDLEDVRATWEAWGRADPLWAVLSFPERRGNWDPEEFFATGRHETDEVLGQLATLGLRISRGRCLDFGCGVGRLTQGFARYFEKCDGVDVAASMVTAANRFNTFGDRVSYRVNLAPDLRVFPDDTFDLVYSRIVLQHIRRSLSRQYIQEFVRVIKPGGVACFQVPAGAEPNFVSTVALPEDHCRADVDILQRPALVRAGSVFTCQVRVRNRGTSRWPAVVPEEHWGVGQVKVGNHWRSAIGRLLVADDGRSTLGHDLDPGDDAVVPVKVRAPDISGVVTLEMDLVQEGVRWFADCGSPAARARMVVIPNRGRQAAAGSAVVDVPWEMHTLPEHEVHELISASGGRAVTTVHRGVPAFQDNQYIVTK